LRIIAGRFRGRRLQTSGHPTLRPTSERVREAIFDVLGPGIIDSRVLDLFAGTGAFGFESLSRGAAKVVFVEKDPRTAGSIKQNAVAFGVEGVVAVHACEASRAIRMLSASRSAFDFVFLDPPYESGLIGRILGLSALRSILHSESSLIVESRNIPGRETFSTDFCLCFERTYGDTLVQMFHLNKEE